MTWQNFFREYAVGPARGFIPYRYDSSIVNEEMFRGDDARPCLRAAFGEGAGGADRFFRLVFGYCAGSPEWQGVTLLPFQLFCPSVVCPEITCVIANTFDTSKQLKLR